MKTIYQEIQAPTPRRRLTGLLPPTIALACGGAFLGAFQLLKGNKALMNWLILHVTTPYKHGISWLCGKVPFAVAGVGEAVSVQIFQCRRRSDDFKDGAGSKGGL